MTRKMVQTFIGYRISFRGWDFHYWMGWKSRYDNKLYIICKHTAAVSFCFFFFCNIMLLTLYVGLSSVRVLYFFTICHFSALLITKQGWQSWRRMRSHQKGQNCTKATLFCWTVKSQVHVKNMPSLKILMVTCIMHTHLQEEMDKKAKDCSQLWRWRINRWGWLAVRTTTPHQQQYGVAPHTEHVKHSPKRCQVCFGCRCESTCHQNVSSPLSTEKDAEQW